MLPFVSSVVETVQLPLQSSASTLQQLCRDILTLSKTEGELALGLTDLFYLACMLLLAALRSDRGLAINNHVSGAAVLASYTLINQLEPHRPFPVALHQVIGTQQGVIDLASAMLQSPFCSAIVEEVSKDPPVEGQFALRLGGAAKRLLLR